MIYTNVASLQSVAAARARPWRAVTPNDTKGRRHG